ncbi:SPRY domain-containing SOCS box protein 3-like [Antedon mediterranea]|uniref:SPRY domain-containing SOCS box protein 3-like n=1 Tax=Antedon mediterranea TaxID=105859 RepID=UPI003AF68D40
MADKKTDRDTTKCQKVESQTEVSFSRNRDGQQRNPGLGHEEEDDDLECSAATSTARRGRMERRRLERCHRPSPGRDSNSDSDENEGEMSRRSLRCYFTAKTSHNPEENEATTSDLAAIEDEAKRSFDWVWDRESKSTASHVTLDEREVNFHLEYSCGTAACRGTMEMGEGQHYWEIKMVSSVYGTDMMVGIGTKEINFNDYSQTFCSLLGNDNNGESCGLSYTGAFHFAGSTNVFCGKFGQTDVIGVHLDMWKGTLSFYKNGQRLGTAKNGLVGKSWYPMVCSTAARSSMRLVQAVSYPSSLQFMCCTVLRKNIPVEKNVLTALPFPPGLKNYLNDRLSWLLGSQVDPTSNIPCYNKGTQTLLTIKGKLYSTEDGEKSK